MSRFNKTPPVVCVLLCAVAFAWSAKAQEGAVQHVHDPHIIKAGGVYYVFSTGNGIPIRRSRDLRQWENAGRVFNEDLPDWAVKAVPGAKFPWAPDILHFSGEYRLYYSISTFGSNRSCIGLAVNKTLDPHSPDYRWVDRGRVIESRSHDNWNAIDANPVLDMRGAPLAVPGIILERRQAAAAGCCQRQGLCRRHEAPFIGGAPRGERYRSPFHFPQRTILPVRLIRPLQPGSRERLQNHGGTSQANHRPIP